MASDSEYTFEPCRWGVIEEGLFDGKTVVLSEGEAGDGVTLEIQRDFSPGDYARENGQDTYCLVVSGGPTFFGGVVRYSISPEELVLDLSPEAARRFEYATFRLPLLKQGGDLVSFSEDSQSKGEHQDLVEGLELVLGSPPGRLEGR